MGPKARYVGTEIPQEDLIWQDPIPSVDFKLVDAKDIAQLKSKISKSGLSNSDLISTAWASASSYRGTDMRGGANGARIRLAPQKDWEVNNPAQLKKVIAKLEKIQNKFNRKQSDGKKISLADLIVLAGAVGIEKAAKKSGHQVHVAFIAGRNDALQAQTDVASFNNLKPTADGFRNYFADGNFRSPADMLVDKASLLELSVPEMTVLLGGMRTLDINYGGSDAGVLTDSPGTLNNNFFVNLLDMATKWSKSKKQEGLYEGRDRKTGKLKWTATPVDLIFGSNSELRAIAEVYAADDAEQKFYDDFIKAWTKVMRLDRFDLDS